MMTDKDSEELKDDSLILAKILTGAAIIVGGIVFAIALYPAHHVHP